MTIRHVIHVAGRVLCGPARVSGFAVGVVLTAFSASAQPAGAQLVVTAAAPGDSGDTLTITGQNFGTRPFVTLDLIPLPLRLATDTELIASAPIGDMPAREYLLTVSRGPAPQDTGSFQFEIGRASCRERV